MSKLMTADAAIVHRKTEKILADEPWDLDQAQGALSQLLDELLELAAYAPYHKKCDEIHQEGRELDSCVPWRFYVLDQKSCRSLLRHIEEHDLKTGKIAQMLSSAQALMMVTWLPSLPDNDESMLTNYTADRKEEGEGIPFYGSIRNMEHIAAAAAAIQNVLIGAAARDIPNYWSSGGALRNPPLREHLSISLTEILLGAIFIFPRHEHGRRADVKLGKMRNEGKERSSWCRHVQLI